MSKLIMTVRSTSQQVEVKSFNIFLGNDEDTYNKVKEHALRIDKNANVSYDMTTRTINIETKNNSLIQSFNGETQWSNLK